MGEGSKVVLVTGASSGIGCATAIELARRGHRVYASMRDLAKASEIREGAEAVGARVEVVELDVREDASVRRAVDSVIATAGRIDVVVNNAGIISTTPLERTTDDAIAHLFDTNVFGPLRVARAAIPIMRAQGHGRIVNVGSDTAEPRTGMALMGAYAMSKAALRTLSLELVKEVYAFGIEVVLCEEGVNGKTAMAATMHRDVEAKVASPDPDYEPLERALARIDAFFHANVPGPERAAVMIADACTLDGVGITHPRAQPRIAGAHAMDERTYLALCHPRTRAETVGRLGSAAGTFALWD